TGHDCAAGAKPRRSTVAGALPPAFVRKGQPVNDLHFLPAISAELHARGVPFDSFALAEFVADAWPFIADDPTDVSKWADAFEESHAPRSAALTFNNTVIAHISFA